MFFSSSTKNSEDDVEENEEGIIFFVQPAGILQKSRWVRGWGFQKNEKMSEDGFVWIRGCCFVGTAEYSTHIITQCHITYALCRGT